MHTYKKREFLMNESMNFHTDIARRRISRRKLTVKRLAGGVEMKVKAMRFILPFLLGGGKETGRQ